MFERATTGLLDRDELAEPLKTEQEIRDEVDNLKKAINKYLGLELSGSYEYGKGTLSFFGRINNEYWSFRQDAYQDGYQFVGPAIKFKVLPQVPDRFKPVICLHSTHPEFKSIVMSAGSTNNDGELRVIDSPITYDQWCSVEDLSVHSEGWTQEWTDWAVKYLEELDK